MELNIEEFNIFRSVNKDLTREDIQMMKPLNLAFIGDVVYEILVRTEILNKNKNSHELHKIKSKIVSAKGQAESLRRIEDRLTEDEKKIVNRASGAKYHTIPKNANLHDYRLASAFEALYGYLYLLGEDERILELYNLGKEPTE